ncbi:MAG: tetratricopeptide repeat protein [Bacteroidota bacterium]
MKKTLTLIIILLASVTSLTASENQLIIAKANKAYSDGMYANAAELYKQVIATGNVSWELYYNLGNAFFKLNDNASAILYYERARKLNPGSEDIDFNLKVANNRIADKIEPIPEFFAKKWFRNAVEFFPVDRWATLVVLSFLIALGSFSLFILARTLLIRKTGFWFGFAFLFIALLFSLFSWKNYQAIQNNSSAIIFSPTVTIKSSPDEKSIDLFVLHEGTKVEIMDHIGNWSEIRISNGSVGWLLSSTIEKI